MSALPQPTGVNMAPFTFVNPTSARAKTADCKTQPKSKTKPDQPRKTKDTDADLI